MDYSVSDHFTITVDKYILCFCYGKRLYNRKKFKTSLKLFKRAFYINQTDSCLNYIGCCYIALKDYAAAECCLNNLIQKRSKWIQPYINMARVYLNSKVPEKAYPFLKKAEQIDAQNVDVLFYLGKYYSAVKDYGNAIRYLQKSLDIKYDQADGHLTLGAAYYRAELFQQALKEFIIGYELDNTDLDARFDQALAYMALKEDEKALGILIEVTRSDPNNEKFMRTLGACYYRLQKYEDAKSTFVAVLKLDPQNEYAQKNLRLISEIEKNPA